MAFLALLALPFAIAFVAVAVSEAFFGTKEPMFHLIGGLFVGALLAIAIGSAMCMSKMKSSVRNMLLGAVLAIDVAAIPLARWLIAFAYSFPSHRIDF